MSSAIYFNLDQSKIFSSGNGLNKVKIGMFQALKRQPRTNALQEMKKALQEKEKS